MSTLWFWMQQSDEARLRFEKNLGDDPFDLQYLAKSFVDTFRKMTAGFESYVICAKGPQFDLVAIESLLNDLGLEAPWEYDQVVDLRTLLQHAKINPKEVPTPDGFVNHVAYWDARYQIDQYLACKLGRVIHEPDTATKLAEVGQGLPETNPQRSLPIGKPGTVLLKG